MRYRHHHPRRLMLSMTAMLLAAGLPQAAQAQTSPDMTSKLLIAILVKKGVLSQSDANSILQEAQAEAAAAPNNAIPAPPAATAANTVSVTSTTTPDGALHVTYIPPIVRQQIATAVTQQMSMQEEAQDYSGSTEVPAWVSRLHFYGDVRSRFEADLFPRGNDPEIVNFNAINTGNPFDVSAANPDFEPRYNSTENRKRFALRARLGVDADLGDNFTMGIRLATGQTNSPVSENQTIGNANNAQGGNFSKDAIWLDRAYLAYTPQTIANLHLTFKIGRFDNPFFSTNMIWADDLGFDGAMATASAAFGRLAPFITAGGFPVQNTAFNFDSSTSAMNYPSHDKYLLAAQAGAAYQFNQNYTAKLAIANYEFTKVKGEVSAPCQVFSASDTCSTDSYRPSFAQNGNTYMTLRDLVPVYNSSNQQIDEYQYFGLASGFNELALTGEFDIHKLNPTDIWITGEYARNLAFNSKAVANMAFNNRQVVQTTSSGVTTNALGRYQGGNNAFYLNVSFGHKVLQQRWDWNLLLGYKYIESDAVMDAFNDSDFGLGGTNLKGYIIDTNVALSQKVSVRLRYLSADSIAGAPYNSDVVQLDLNAKF